LRAAPRSHQVVYRLYPSRSQEAALLDMLGAHQRLYNAALEQRKGTLEKPGKRVAQKTGLNREILATAPATFLSMLRYKAEEAGSLFIETPTKTLKPSQRCSDCGLLPKVKKTLSERRHVCACGCVLTRDQNGARNNLVWALNRLGREPARNSIHTPRRWVA